MEKDSITNESNPKNNDLDFKPTYKVIPLSEDEKKKYNFQSKAEKGTFYIGPFFFITLI
jgi:hypothetical protein